MELPGEEINKYVLEKLRRTSFDRVEGKGK